MKVLFITRDLIQNAGWGRTSYETIRSIEMDKTITASVAVEKIGGKEGEVEKVIQILPSKSIWNIFKNIATVWKVRKQYDVFHAMDLWPYGFYAWIASWGNGKSKYVINGIGTYSVAPLDKTFFGPIAKYIYQNAHAIPCISEFTKQEIDKRIQGARTSVVLQGFTSMHSDEQYQSFLAEKGITDTDYPVIITVGEAKPRKGHIYTAQAVSMLKEKYPNIKYLIVCNSYAKGYMADIEYINTTAGGNMIKLINDAKTDGHLEALYKRANVFALNSVNSKEGHFEGFGLVILEANQFGIPAVGSMGCGIESAIRDGVNGYLCRQQDANDIADKIEKILSQQKNDPEYWPKQTIEFCNTFSWERAGKEYINLYK